MEPTRTSQTHMPDCENRTRPGGFTTMSTTPKDYVVVDAAEFSPRRSSMIAAFVAVGRGKDL
ncbi:hypothetical protein B2J88_50910 [Rhodococcus sp. SRB_17]|nr:hypothetical protein [Rhodococcus sp. SRB_17]